MKYLRIISIIIAFVLIFFVVRQAYLYFGKGTLSISARPNDASVVIDKKVYTTQTAQNISLSPGEHTIIVALDGFKTVEQTITMGWQDDQRVIYQLTPKSFKDIYQNLSTDVSFTNYEVINPRFFKDNTWAAAYISSQDGDNEYISVAVIKRENKAWKLIFHDHEIPDEAQSTLPPEVYNYIKDFQE